MKKIAIVTGGSSGIGKAAALMLCENGYTVYEFSRRGENYSSIFHITADVTNPASIAAAAAKVIEKEGRIDLLVNNAGFGISGPVEFTDPADAHAQLEVTSTAHSTVYRRCCRRCALRPAAASSTSAPWPRP